MSPVGTVIETQVVRWMCDLAGFGAALAGRSPRAAPRPPSPACWPRARSRIPDVWQRGRGATRRSSCAASTRTTAVSRAIGELGIGTNNTVAIPSREFRMDVASLERELTRLRARGAAVMAVVATAGTTATGSFDDLEAIGQLCEARGIWLHVDGAHGASALLSASTALAWTAFTARARSPGTRTR